MAALDAISITSSSITVKVSGLDKEHKDPRTFKWFLNGTQVATTTLSPGNESTSYTYRGLAPDTSYSVEVEIWDKEAENFYTLLEDKYTTLDEPLQKWNWTSSELNAFNNNGPVSTLTAARWSSFIDTINRVAHSKGAPQIESSARASSGQTITANKFNPVNNCIHYMNHTGVPWVSPGDIIYGWYFTAMSDAFNSIT